MNRPYNTLYMVQSLDGKISSGIGPSRDIDIDIAHDMRFNQGMKQYYDENTTTDYWCLITDVIVNKLTLLHGRFLSDYHNHGFILWYNGHCSKDSIKHLAAMCESLIVVHDSDTIVEEGVNVRIITVEDTHDVVAVMKKLKDDCSVDRISVQSGGTLNASLFRAELIDEIILHVAPTLLFGKSTPTLADGEDSITDEDISSIPKLRLLEIKTTEQDFIRLHYKIEK